MSWASLSGIWWANEKITSMMERISCMCATEVICVSVGVKQTLLSDHICKEQKLKVIAYGSAMVLI